MVYWPLLSRYVTAGRKTEILVLNRILAGRLTVLAATSILASCATSPSVEVIRTLLDPAVDDARFENILVISVAGDYAERAEMEQKLSTKLGGNQTLAAPYYSVIGRGPQVSRNLINTGIMNRSFDSVLFVRAVGQDIPNLAPGRPTGQAFQLFLYDYNEFNRPERIAADSSITLVSEFYSTAAEKKIWAIETLSFDHASTTDLIDQHAEAIASHVRKDGLTVN